MNIRRGRTFRRRRNKELQSVHRLENIDEFHELFKWMGKRGFKNYNKLMPRMFEDTGRGLMSMKNLIPGDTIIGIPLNLLIIPGFVLRSQLGSLIKKFCPSATGIEVLTIFLLYEKVQRQKSEWFPYINTLPPTYDLPIFFDSKILELLPSLLNEQAVEQCRKLEESYMKFLPLFAVLNRMFSTFDITFDLYKWAFATVNSRCVYKSCPESECFDSSYNLALAPFLDFLNHNPSTKVDANFNDDTNCYEIKCCNFIKKYSQVFINYGAHDNRKLFLEYGFVITGNVNDQVTVSFDDIVCAYKNCHSTFPADRIEFISKGDLLSKKMGVDTEGPSWNLETVLRILCDENDTLQWKSIVFRCSTPTTAENSTKYRRLFKEIVAQKLLKYDRLIEQFLPEFSDYSHHLELARSLLEIERRILHNNAVQFI